MRSASSFIAGSLLLVATAIPAAAQLGAGSWEVEPFVGVTSYDDDLFLDTTTGFGGRLGYNFTDNWALEGTFNYTPGAEFEIDDGVDLDVGPETDVILAHANLNYNFLLNNSRLVPFLTAGGGLANRSFDNDIDSETDGAVNAGGGLKLFLTETVALRGDLRNHWIFASTPNQYDDELDDERDAETTSNLEVSAGVTLNF